MLKFNVKRSKKSLRLTTKLAQLLEVRKKLFVIKMCFTPFKKL